MQDKTITSLTNPRIKEIVRLRNRKERDQTGLTIVEGYKEILQAKKAGICLKELYTCEDFFHKRGEKDLVTGIAVECPAVINTTKEVFQKISFGDRHGGLLAVCAQPKLKFSDYKLSDMPFIVVIEGIEKPGNLGAILRTCDAAGLDGVIVSNGNTDIYNPNVIRSSLGAVFSVPILQSTNDDAFQFLKSHHIKICAALPQAETSYNKANLSDPMAIVMGSEQKGLSDFWIEKADSKIRIPMYGKVDSLNVATTTAIIIYEAIRQRESQN